MTYAEEKLSEAIFSCIAIGEGDARDRLSKSFKYFLHTLTEEHFTRDHWKRFKKVKNRLIKNGPFLMNDRIIVGAFENGKVGMKNKTASRLIEELIIIYRELAN